jgi:tetratricopeptide (TPR) repeat protein
VLEKVLSEFGAALGEHAESAEAYYALGVTSAVLGRLSDAEGALRHACEVKPDYGWGHYALGLVLGERGHQAEAVDELEIALKHCRTSAETCMIRRVLGSAQFARGRYSDAVSHFEAALELRPGDPLLISNLGASLLASGDTERACQQLCRALDADPHLLSALRNLGTLYLKLCRFDEARGLLERAVTLDPDHVSTLRKLAVACMEQGDEGGAEKHMQRAIDLEDDAGGPDAA